MMKTTMSSKGRVVLPAKLRRQDAIAAGQEFNVERIAPGEYRFTRRPRANDGLVEWLLACPKKGFFAPSRSESTDTQR